MRTLKSKMAPILALAVIALVACGKKDSKSDNATVQGINSSGFPSYYGNYNPYNYQYPNNQYQTSNNGAGVFNIGYKTAYCASACEPFGGLNLENLDTLEYLPNDDFLYYRINGGSQVATPKSVPVKIVASGNSYVTMGKTKFGQIELRNIVIRRCVDGSNNRIACP